MVCLIYVENGRGTWTKPGLELAFITLEVIAFAARQTTEFEYPIPPSCIMAITMSATVSRRLLRQPFAAVIATRTACSIRGCVYKGLMGSNIYLFYHISAQHSYLMESLLSTTLGEDSTKRIWNRHRMDALSLDEQQYRHTHCPQ